MLFKTVNCKFAQAQHVLIDQRVKKEVIKDWLDDALRIVAAVTIKLQHVHRRAEHAKTCEEEEHEALQVHESRRQQLDIKRGRLEQAKPVEQFHPKENDGECGDYSVQVV